MSVSDFSEGAAVELKLVACSQEKVGGATATSLGEVATICTLQSGIVALDDDIAKVDSDPKHEPLADRDTRVALRHAALHLDCTAHRIDDARKFHQYAVTGRLDDSAAMLGDLGIDKGAAVRHSCSSVPSSFRPISREDPATSAARTAAKRRMAGVSIAAVIVLLQRSLKSRRKLPQCFQVASAGRALVPSLTQVFGTRVRRGAAE